LTTVRSLFSPPLVTITTRPVCITWPPSCLLLPLRSLPDLHHHLRYR
jgi:hypothetical protein